MTHNLIEIRKILGDHLHFGVLWRDLCTTHIIMTICLILWRHEIDICRQESYVYKFYMHFKRNCCRYVCKRL